MQTMSSRTTQRMCPYIPSLQDKADSFDRKERLTRLLAKYEDGKLKATSTVENPAGPNTPPASPGPEKKEKKAPAKRGKAKATVAKKTATRKTTGAGNGRGKKRKIEQVEVEEENDEGGCENKENGGEART